MRSDSPVSMDVAQIPVSLEIFLAFGYLSPSVATQAIGDLATVRTLAKVK